MITHIDLALATDTKGDAVRWISKHPDWIVTTKVDGIRCLARDGRLITRGGMDVTDRFPEVRAPKGWTLDTELAVVNPRGDACFESTVRRANGGHRGSDGEARLFVFDVLETPDGDIRKEPYAARQQEAGGWGLTSNVTILLPLDDPTTSWHETRLFEQEGLVARDPAARYLPGRSKSFVRLKHRRTTDAVVVGRSPGRGSTNRGSFGALKLALVDGEHARVIGEVGSGFSADDRAQIEHLFRLKRPFVCEVTHLGWTSGALLRQPAFVRLRLDLDPTRVGAQ